MGRGDWSGERERGCEIQAHLWWDMVEMCVVCICVSVCETAVLLYGLHFSYLIHVPSMHLPPLRHPATPHAQVLCRSSTT